MIFLLMIGYGASSTLLPMQEPEITIDPSNIEKSFTPSFEETNVQIKILQHPQKKSPHRKKIHDCMPKKYKNNITIHQSSSSIGILVIGILVMDTPIPLFKPGKVELNGHFLNILKNIYPHIKSSVTIHVHSDASGSHPARNKELSQKRAQWIADQFKKLGLVSKKIVGIKGHGSQFLKNKKHPLSLQNRRVFFKIS